MLPNLRILDYHYVRFCFQPVEDKFSVCGTWMDPSWTDVKSLRRGLEADERESREQAFGGNIIDIQEKTIPQILIDEVSGRIRPSSLKEKEWYLICEGFPSVLYLPSC